MMRTWVTDGSEQRTHLGGESDCGTTIQTIAVRHLVNVRL